MLPKQIKDEEELDEPLDRMPPGFSAYVQEEEEEEEEEEEVELNEEENDDNESLEDKMPTFSVS